MPEDDDLEISGRTFWSGTITFGLVSVPVALMPANRSLRTSLRMVSPDGNPLTRRYFATADDRPLDWDEIVRGYEIEKDKFVVVEDEELERLAPERTRDIDLQVFVKGSEIDPMHFERAYYLVPAGGTTKAYRLLARVMEETDRAGIATFVMRGKEYLVAILAEDGILRAETLRFANEVRTPEKIGLPDPMEPKSAEVTRMAKQIEKLSKPRLDTSELQEKSAERLLKIVQKKKKAGEDIVHYDPEVDEEKDSKEVLDLVEMLRRSLQTGDVGSPKGNGKAKSERSAKAKSEKSTTKAKSEKSETKAKSEKSETKAKSNGKGKTASLEKKSRSELYERAQKLDIPGRSSMTKEELIEALEGA